MIEETRFNIHIHSFNSNGKPIYAFSQESHIFWGKCICEASLIDQWDNDDDYPSRSSKIKKKSMQKSLRERYGGDLEIGLSGEASGKFDYYVLYSKGPEECNMIQPALYDEDLPPLDFEHDNASHMKNQKSNN
ncbi:hypothetical protein POM88_023157 [Heracleum sosnowskyi]|uniref:Uncharacterized protein n=1 Tax=Heracleum sosnowskyi TaxID=360622 RepID=A0AAD8IJA6_9APIA|nr:hypothetical protein POM88_023157 [Heracleum sosnowskyi]